MALDFEASSTDRLYWTVDSPPSLPVTLATWVNYDDTGVSSRAFSIGDSGNVHHCSIGVQGDDAHIAQHWDGTQAVDTTGTRSSGVLYHLCGVFRSTTDREIAIDGALSGSAVTTSQNAITLNRIAISVSADSTPSPDINGKISESAVWDVALTAAEIATLASGYSPLFVRPASLIFYFPGINLSDVNRISGITLSTFGDPLNAPVRVWQLRPVVHEA